jgi:hypothetical protein
LILNKTDTYIAASSYEQQLQELTDRLAAQTEFTQRLLLEGNMNTPASSSSTPSLSAALASAVPSAEGAAPVNNDTSHSNNNSQGATLSSKGCSVP